MSNATKVNAHDHIHKINFSKGNNVLMSNVTADKISEISEIQNLLIKQIESRVRWRESVVKMISDGVENFIEIGPGKVLSGLIKRIDKKVKVQSVNNEEDIKNLII